VVGEDEHLTPSLAPIAGSAEPILSIVLVPLLRGKVAPASPTFLDGTQAGGRIFDAERAPMGGRGAGTKLCQTSLFIRRKGTALA
jgi:hypothetical protein